MSEPSIVLTQRVAFGVLPEIEQAGSAGAVALWRFQHDSCREVGGTALPAHHIVCIALRGTMSDHYHADGKSLFDVTWQPGHSHVIRAGEEPHALVSSADASFLHIYLPDRVAQLAAREFGVSARWEFEPSLCDNDLRLDHIAQGLLAEAEHSVNPSRLALDSWFTLVAVHLLKHRSTVSDKGFAVRGGLTPRQQRRVLDALAERLAEDLPLAELAGIANLSTFHFCRAFKQSTGFPPHTYQRHLRCERAKELLLTTNLPVTEIALSVGYESSQALARMFAHETGSSPSTYRRERRR